tara:strand:- start:383 stop:556 length:174 start_codon:yes stop_codon:yes gene_type:complete
MIDIVELARRRADTRGAYLKTRNADPLVRVLAENAYLESDRAYRAAIEQIAERERGR